MGMVTKGSRKGPVGPEHPCDGLGFTQSCHCGNWLKGTWDVTLQMNLQLPEKKRFNQNQSLTNE